MDASGQRHKGVLTADDMAGWHATIEAPQTYDYHDWTVAKIGPWGQGPVFLQSCRCSRASTLPAWIRPARTSSTP